MIKCPYDFKVQLDGVMCFDDAKCKSCRRKNKKQQGCVASAQQLLVSNIHYMIGFVEHNGRGTNVAGEMVYVDPVVAQEKIAMYKKIYSNLNVCKCRE